MKQVKNSKASKSQYRRKNNRLFSRKKLLLGSLRDPERSCYPKDHRNDKSFPQMVETNNWISGKTKSIYKMPPLVVSATSWIAVAVDNKKSLLEKPFNTPNLRSKFKISTEDNTSLDTSEEHFKSHNKNEDFIFEERNYFNLSNNCHEQREIASLTKIMTCYTILKLVEKYNINKTEELVTISGTASMIGGTSALLKTNEVLSVWDLLHGLMLPSGNDAAYALAEHFGGMLQKKSIPKKSTMFYNITEQSSNCNQTVFHKSSSSFSEESKDGDNSPTEPSTPVSYFKGNPRVHKFIQEMNRNARKLRMMDTNFDSPHGLPNKYNKSTAYDIAKLCMEATKIEDFNTITKCKIYQCNSKKKRAIRKIKHPKNKCANYRWTNTNKLLSKGYCGIKTGITTAAGPCLAALLSKKNKSYIVVLLNSRSLDSRWEEIRQIVDHCQYEGSQFKKDFKSSPSRSSYPLSQFKQKKSVSFYRSRYDESSIYLREPKFDKQKKHEDLLLPSIDLK
ncbi:unnamed protein product [Moneuplotes crassus]|uniref:Peptidase S11 D-alanyl-D-alanine carboxypeptidase A N-terminal domain-containing protein n=1 Tax=Euplotes crassus TaxID=5936 RepID=A0AAD1U2I8_EUPCR|nr:unnamed protein product [Moneuplotes crassus]